MSQRSSILYNLINNPFVYRSIQKLMSGTSFRKKIVQKNIKNKKFKILDIGCGPAEILDYQLGDINFLRKEFNVEIGLSDHTVSNLIRIHSPDILTSQENYKSDRAQAVKRKVELEDSVEPIISEIFRLYYITPEQAKATIEELFTQRSGDNSK